MRKKEKKMISKELLSEVLNLVEVKGIYEESDYTYDLCDRELNYAERLIVFDTVGYNKYMIINIHELAHKCKEWLNKIWYCYDISSTTNGLDIRVIIWNTQIKEYFHENTEHEAIFKACEWIRKHK